MKILLDTHAFLWFIVGNPQLDNHARQLIEDPNNERFLSVASIWEMTIKASLGRLIVPTPPSLLIRDHVWSNAIELLELRPEHFDILNDLPYHHKDPFDRLIISQAQYEEMTLVSKDQAFDQYDVKLKWSN